MNLQKYLSLLGDSASSELFGITKRAAASYRLGDRLPRPDVAARIVAKSNGNIKWEEIYSTKGKQK